MSTVDYKRILRNTGMLYVRMLFAMVVTLYTSRVVLVNLGVVDFGIYHVVAGFVALIGFLQGAMTNATQRYYSFDIGETGGENLSRIFTTSLQIHFVLAVGIAMVAETAGFWFVSTQLTIPPDRLDSALTAYHLAILGFSITVMTVPFAALLIAHEKMGPYAMIGIGDVLLKLAAAVLMTLSASDKIVVYAWLMTFVGGVTLVVYWMTINRMYPNIRWITAFDREQFKTMFSFTAWNTWGNLASVLSTQGNNILLNIYFGPTVNSARTIAYQASGAIGNFLNSIQSSVNPQITKSYAERNNLELVSLLSRASKLYLSIYAIISAPIYIYADSILYHWLDSVPEYSTLFLRLVIINSLIESANGPFKAVAIATGNIRRYQTILGSILLTNLPISLVLINVYDAPYIIFISSIATSIIAQYVRIRLLRSMIGIDLMGLFFDVGLRFIPVLCFIAIIFQLIPLEEYGVSILMMEIMAVSVVVAGFLLLVMPNSTERQVLINVIIRRLKK